MISRTDPLDLARSVDRVARPRRFYEAVSVTPGDGGHFVMLDAHRARTPGRATLAVADRPLAVAVAAEWAAQEKFVDPATMPLTRIVNSAIDAVAVRIDATRGDIVAYAGNDLICYRATTPAELAARQTAAWDPLLAWASDALGARLVTGAGIVPIDQPGEALAGIGAALASFDALPLAALHVATTLTGSAILALSLAHRRLSAEEAWAAAHIDEDWQATQWGKDGEAAARRAARWREMAAASFVLDRTGISGGAPPQN
jgi:chaperone required for assembly of F1-ATPase